MDYVQQARDLVRNLHQRMSPSPYDIAWLARLPAGENGSARWPDLIEWLAANQHADGSWGGAIRYYHDRIICTLAAAIALQENGHTAQARRAIRRAERYVWQHLHLLPRDPMELVGFELIFPTLLETARELGLDVPSHTCGYGRIQHAKLRLIPPEMLYSPQVSTVHSLEFLGRLADPARLREAQAANGSLGNSPATTAFYLLFDRLNERAWSYLDDVQQHMGHVNNVYPFRTFNLTWVLNNLAFCGAPLTEFAGPEIWQRLSSEIHPDGVGADPSFGIPDGDTTSVCIRLLRSAGYEVEPEILAKFEDPQQHIFRTYRFERNASVGTNVHALEALHLLPDYPERRTAQERIVLMLLDQQKLGLYWTDKWHASPYYATTHALIGLLQRDFYLAYFCHPTIDWLEHTQREDGSWGYFEHGTVEETAYALTALLHYNRHRRVNQDVLHRGGAYLTRTCQSPMANHPPLWIEKCLYTPYEIIQAAVLAALILYEEAFGRSA